MAAIAEPSALTRIWRQNPVLVAGLGLAFVVLLRTVVVLTTPLEIGPDEAQYWRWSRTLDWGYYSKPPLIAWAIALSTSVFGDAEWAIRLLAPAAHGIAAFFLFLLGRRMFDARTGAWAATLYILMPGVWLSSTIMSTDAVLLPAWSAAMYYLWRLRDEPKVINGVLAGACIGLAMLAKYAALYLFSGALFAAMFDRKMRQAILSPFGVFAAVAAMVVLGPNLAWNAANGFATVSHTADNANLGAATFNPLNLFQFVADQMAVFGPLTILLLLAGIFLFVRRGWSRGDIREGWLLCFILPPLLVIAAQAVISRAHANWAASAYPAACVLVAFWLTSVRWNALIKGGLAINVLIGALFTIVWVAPQIGDAVGITGVYKRVRGWEDTATGLARIARENDVSALMFDEREIWHGVDYYGRNIADLPPVRSWRRLDQPRSHAEEAGALQPGEDRRVLVASVRGDFRPRIRADFETAEPAGDLTISLGGDKVRHLKLYLASGYKPLPRTPEYEASFEGKRE